MLDRTQAMNNDKYMDDFDWYKFNTSRASNPNLSDQSRWEASQLAAKNAADMNRKSEYKSNNLPTAHDIYSASMYDITKQYGNYLPPLNSLHQNNTTAYYPHSSSSSVNYSVQRQEDRVSQYGSSGGCRYSHNGTHQWETCVSTSDYTTTYRRCKSCGLT